MDERRFEVVSPFQAILPCEYGDLDDDFNDDIAAVTLVVMTSSVMLLLQVDTADAQRLLLQAGTRSRRHLPDHDPTDSNDKGTCCC